MIIVFGLTKGVWSFGYAPGFLPTYLDKILQYIESAEKYTETWR